MLFFLLTCAAGRHPAPVDRFKRSETTSRPFMGPGGAPGASFYAFPERGEEGGFLL